MFPFFPKDFRGSLAKRNPRFYRSFSLLFTKKKQGKEDQGHVKMTLANAKSVNRQTLENVVRNAASEFTRRTAIASLASLRIGVEAEGLLDYQGRAGIISIVRWNVRPVIFGVEICFPGRARPVILRPVDRIFDAYREGHETYLKNAIQGHP